MVLCYFCRFKSLLMQSVGETNSSLAVLYLRIFENLLEPSVTLEDLQQQPKPVRTFFEQCQKQGRKPEIKNLCSGENNIARAYVDGVLVALGSSDQMVIARRNAAKLALLELPNFMPTNIT
uniref:Uncharacterized protein n=1 Tax=Quercus lobata TaxID=97700 RepID=A0A7N2R8Q3_QUELO